MSGGNGRATWCALALLVAGCGGGPNSPAPVDAVRSTLTASPSAATADGVASVTLTATARDAGGAPLPGRAVSFAVTGAACALASTTATTGADGTATTSLTSTAAGAKAISATIDGVAIPAPAVATFIAGAPSALAFALQPASGPAGEPLHLTVGVVDAQSNPVAGAFVSLSLQDGAPGATLGGAAPLQTDDSGLARFTGLSVAKAGAGYAIEATCGAARATSARFDVAAGAPSPATSRVVASPSEVVAGGPPARVEVTALDALGNAVEGAVVSVTSSSLGDHVAAPGPTSADGTTTALVAGTRAGGREVAAFVGGVPIVQTAALTVLPAAPDAASSSVTGPAGPVVADGTPAAISVTVRDAFGNPVPSLPVTFSATGATLSAAGGTTGMGGDATLSVASTVAGSATVTIGFAGGRIEAPVLFVAGPAASLELAGLPATLPAGTRATVTITARDERGNVAAGYRGTVHLVVTDPGARLPAEVAFEPADAGRRTVELELRTAGRRDLTVADATTPTLTASATTVVTPLAADRLALTGLTSPVLAGRALTATVTALDVYGNVATAYRGAVGFMSSDPAATIPAGYAFQVADAGRHTFADLELRTAGVQAVTVTDLAAATLTAEVAGLQVDPAAAASLAFTVQPSPTEAGAMMTPAVQVSVLDPFGNVVSAPTSVELAESGGAMLFGVASAVTSQGHADFPDLWLRKAGAAHTLVATSPGLVGAESDPFTITAGPASPSGSSLSLSTATAPDDGTAVGLTVTVGDAFGNPVAGLAVSLSSSGVATFTGPAAPTGLDGTATAAVSALVAGTQTITARVGDTPIATGELTFTAAPPSPSTSGLAVTPAAIPADGVSAATVTVTARDALGRPREGVPVALACTAAAAIAPPAAITDAEGRATFAVSSSTVGSGVLTATLGPGPAPVVVAQTGTVEFTEPTYAVGGSIAGLGSPGLVLASPGFADLAVDPGATTFAFAERVVSGTRYSVSVAAQPVGLTCAVEGGSGQVGSAPVTGIAVTCTGWTSIAAGLYHTVGVKADGTLWAWGENLYGQLGTGDTTRRLTATQVGSGFAAVTAGAYHTVAVKSDGTLWAWGYNGAAQLGDGTTTQRTAPVQVGTGFRTVAAGFYHSMAIDRGGALYAWGDNGSGQLGTGTTTRESRPRQIGTGYAQVAAGAAHTMGVKADGTLLAWGDNGFGQLGMPGTASQKSPQVIGTGYATVAAAGFHTLAVKGDGTLLGCGENASGLLGTGDTTGRTSLTPIGAGFATVATGSFHSLALTTTGALLAFGRGGEGQLGDGAGVGSNVPVLVGAGFVRLAAGDTHSLAVRRDGTLWAWGQGSRGQLGGVVPASPQPVPFRIGAGYASVASGASHTLAVTGDGTLLAWGDNTQGQLGTGDTAARTSPTPIDVEYAAVAAGAGHSFGIKTDGSLWGWGENSYQQLGTGDGAVRAAPTLIGSGFAAVSTSRYHTVALKTDGSLWVWGYNGSGELGTGQQGVSKSTPFQLGTGYLSAAAGTGFTLAIRSDGTLWAWGSNTWGQLGTSTPGQKLTPTFVAGGYARVAAGNVHSAGLTADGTLMTWGNNQYGQLGLGDTAARSQPTPAGPGLSLVVAGDSATMAIDANGLLLAAGNNDRGQLGIGSTVSQARLTTVGPGFAAIAAGDSHAAAVLSDGTLWTWGANSSGQLGRSAYQLVPAPVP